jgi:hypothetical protein
MIATQTAFPSDCLSVGKKVEYLSRMLLPQRRFDEYVALMGQILDENIHYIDPVHELRGRAAVLKMLAEYVPRAANDKFSFELISEGEKEIIWRWVISLKIRFSRHDFLINGLVRARVENGRIVYQREYYDPMESIGVIPMVGSFYKRMLKMA